jgi:hypothetical protein
MGVYGDHSTDGWLEWGLQERAVQRRAEREAKGDFGAADEIQAATEVVERATTINHLRRAEILFRNAGILAAREALFQGVKIKGWGGKTSNLELPPFERDEAGATNWFGNANLRRLEALPDRYQILANLADNALLKPIRQTGSRLVPPDREIKFARQRVDKAAQVLKDEQEELEELFD